MKYLPLPSQAYLKKHLDYDLDTGLFRWKTTPKAAIKVGDIAGTKKQYIVIGIDGSKYLAHRLAWMYVTGEDPGQSDIDHDDTNKHNNAFSNLRLASKSQNQWNKRVSTNNKLGLKGVYKQGNSYRAAIWKNGKKYGLGSHKTAEEAYQAYCDAATKLHGEFSFESQ